MSPEGTHPCAAIVSAVFSGILEEPLKTLGPRKQISPRPRQGRPLWSRSVDKYDISGTSTSFMSFTASGPPTDPRAWSRGSVTVAAAAISVWPYPSITGTAKTQRRNVKTSAETAVVAEAPTTERAQTLKAELEANQAEAAQA